MLKPQVSLVGNLRCCMRGLVSVHCSIVYMVGTDEESFEWLDVNKSPDEVRILQETVNVLDLPRPPEVRPPDEG